jgi:hypothetical protein
MELAIKKVCSVIMMQHSRGLACELLHIASELFWKGSN